MGKYLDVFFDIETLKTNTGAKNPKDYIVREYSVSVEYDKGKKSYELLFPSLKAMIDHLLAMRNKNFRLIAHNGRRFDFHFLRRALLDYYDLIPVTGYKDAYVDHEKDEHKKDDFKGKENWLIEYRIKAKTNLDMIFNINGNNFVTEDSYPHFQCSIKTMGELLEHHKIIASDDKKLDYDYDRYDKKEKVEDVRAYCNSVFDNLSDHERHYVRNDTHILHKAWINYDTLFPGFDIDKKTLSLNILSAYSINPLAEFQLVNKYDVNFSYKKQQIQYSSFNFMDETLFAYIHHYYHGGLNFYNDKKIGEVVHDLVHIDINSSYPTVMYYEKFPTRLIGYVDHETKLELDDQYYYLLQVPTYWVSDILKSIPSINVRKMIVKYFPSVNGYIYLQSPHIYLFGQFTKKEYKQVPVKSALIFDKYLFGGRDVIKEKYEFKTQAKLQGWSKQAVYTTKVILNGIYGIPALRAYFNVFKYDGGELTSHPFGYKNKERNILFASAVTAYALKNLLMPLTHNVKGLDKGYVYTDTDSHFLTADYWETIKDYVDIHPTRLGAWDMEHKHIKSMYVLNHKKYCLLNDKDKIEVYCGGIPKDAFDTNMPFEKFIDTQFSNGCEIKNLKNTYTKDGVMCLYMSVTQISIGMEYPDCYSKDLEIAREIYKAKALQIIMDDELDDAMYIETEVGSFGESDLQDMLYNIGKGRTYPIDELIRMEDLIFK